ncbi:MAG: autoinducer binding domain-containing protein, partial [Pseudomonadota bacterium]
HEAIKNCCTNFGDAWLGRYTDQKLFLDDPIVDFATLTTSATAWDQLCGLTAFEKRHRNVLGAAREEGIRAGVFMSTRQMNGDTQLISFARAEEREFSDAELHLATVYGQMIAKAMNGAVLECEAVRDLKVSARELECLSLSAIGKSSAEIEVILGISRHTVDFHIKNLMGKLDASTRTYAIVKAIRLGMINP